MPYETQLEGWVEACLSKVHQALSPALQSTLEQHLKARGKAGSPLYNFTRAAQPVVHLPIWVAQSLLPLGRAIPDIHVQNAVGAAVSGYLMAQVQDAVIDGKGTSDPNAMVLAHALFIHHEEYLTPAKALSPLYRARWRSLWRGYTNALSLERQLSRGEGVKSRADFRRILGRSQPMALPAASLLAIAGRDDLLADLEAIIRLTTRAAQLVDDTADALDDLRENNKTWVVCAFGGLEGSKELIKSLYLNEGFNEVLDEAKEDMESARSIAQAKGLLPLAQALAAQKSLIDVVRSEILHSVFEASLSKASPSKQKGHTEPGLLEISTSPAPLQGHSMAQKPGTTADTNRFE